MIHLDHVIEAQQFSREGLLDLFREADQMKLLVKEQGCTETLHNKVMVVLFYQPSTRTRLSFETAMVRLGGRYVSTENALDFSSHAKGESLEDTINTVVNYGDVVVLRYHKEGGAARAAKVSPIPIINAGDGPGQHPTQALLDIYTIQNAFHRVDGLKVALVGDLKHGRTVHSLAYMLGKFNVAKIYLVSPENVRMPADLTEYLDRHGIACEVCDELLPVAHDVDVVYTTRVQREYFDDLSEFQEAYGKYVLTDEVMDELPQESIILHPLPRNDEIPFKIDRDVRAHYFEQVQNGLYVRMALLELLLL
jgi:aspartate carbamoyltransferase catalytic subunit